ncbi:biotin--[acetyl-CoA-carboxylase] ligase [Rhodobacteraceae bacterium 63075]|nr:biotin--[acetyl-CoA-carboxylase] ligase [Rhodobacteraceae bacterium 63075]
MQRETAWPEGYARRDYETLPSTQGEALRLAGGLSAPTWIFAKAQTAPRGRRGRAWAQGQGNFGASLVLPGLGDPAQMGLRSFVASLALYDAVRAVAGPGAQLALKWPNDVLLGGGKLAGILLETAGEALVIGIGVNLAHAPGAGEVEAGAVRPVALAAETQAQMDPESFLTHLAAAFAPWEARFRTHGFAPVREAWLAHAAKLGQPIRARAMREEWQGTFETIDAAGHLVLRTAQGQKSIPAADVFF